MEAITGLTILHYTMPIGISLSPKRLPDTESTPSHTIDRIDRLEFGKDKD